MRAALAPRAVAADAGHRTDPARRKLCAEALYRRRPARLHDRDRAGPARLPAGPHSAAASELAQHVLAAPQSMVRGGGPAGSAAAGAVAALESAARSLMLRQAQDRKSPRLNSSH